MLILFIYLKKILRLSGTSDQIYLSYYYVLIKCNLLHLKETDFGFCVKNSEDVVLCFRRHPSSDAQVLKQIWLDEEYKVVVELINKYLPSGVLNVIDAGANVGYSTSYLYNKLNGKYQLNVVAIEPGTGNLKILKENFRYSGVSNYSIEHAGLYDKNCYLEISNDFRDGKDWSLQVREVNHKTDLKAIEINEIVKKNDWNCIDFIKIDIEGAEEHLFKTGQYASQFLKRIKIIAIEIHDEYSVKNVIHKSFEENNFYYFESGELTIGINRNFININ